MSRAAFFRATFVTAMIPLAMFVISRTTALAPPTVQTAALATDISEPEITLTFRWRWAPAMSLPPADDVRPTESRVDREGTQGTREDLVANTVPVAVVSPASRQPPRHRLTTSYARGDVCTRHKLRKVFSNGGKTWRCRK